MAEGGGRARERRLELQGDPDDWDAAAWFGRVVIVPDRHWGFAAVGRDGHPGVTLSPASLDQRHQAALKGTSLGDRRPRACDLVVEPDDENGLHHATRFDLWPRRLARRGLELMVRDRLVGRLSEADRARLTAELERVLRSGRPEHVRGDTAGDTGEDDR